MGPTSEASSSTAKQRRLLRFESIDDAIAEAERIALADRVDRLTKLGAWTPGQAFGHLSTWCNFAFDGYPPEVRAPLPVRMVLRLLRKRILTRGMPVGVRIRGIPGGTLGIDMIATDQGLQKFREAMQRLGQSAPTIVNPIFGTLTHDQWIALNLRHAELHLGFLSPD
jgi:hypothetical protein